MKMDYFVKCRDCNYEQLFLDRSSCPEQCPQCGSNNIKIGLTSSAKRQGKSDHRAINMIKSHPILFVSIVCSLICGIVAIALYIAYFSNFHIGLVPIEGRCCFNPGLWVVIPIAFGVGFLIPGIAWVLWHLGV